MSDAILLRTEWGDQGTFGRLVAGGLGLFSGELPWRDNAANISCVPPGPDSDMAWVYRCIFTHSPRFGRHLYLLAAVRARAGVRLHPANLMGDAALGHRSQLNGCIAVGEKRGWMDGQKALLLSVPAVRRLESLFGGRPFELEIRNAR